MHSRRHFYKTLGFVVQTNNTIYVIETNFYDGGGSKLNETARSYKMIADTKHHLKKDKIQSFPVMLLIVSLDNEQIVSQSLSTTF